MIRLKRYKYIGQNGSIVSNILLNGIEYIPMVYLEAGDRMMLTNGKATAHSIVVAAIEEDEWYEVPVPADNED